MVWLIQTARTGCARSATSVAWFGLWYTMFSSGWRIALALERPLPGEALSGEAGLGIFLGSIALVGGANSMARYREQVRGTRRSHPAAHSGSRVPC
jgi:hypothetical protein